MISKRKPKKTNDALKILYRPYFQGNPKMQELLEKERLNAEIAAMLYEIRTGAGLSQRALAERVGTTASVICRLEDTDYEGHSLRMLRRIAAVLGKRVEIRFLPPRKRRGEAA